MQKVLYLLLWIIPLSVFGQNRLNIEINLDSIGREIHYDAMGVNVERMFYRILDNKGEMPEEIFQDLMNAEDLIYRWPGGATANFYHFFNGTSKGYGLLREEIESVEHPMKCNNPKGSEFCMSFEEYAPRNYIYDLLDFADRYQEIYHKKKKVIWLPNIFTFYLHNKQEIHQLDKISNLAEAEQLVENGEITADFYTRIKDVVDVFNILMHHPSIELEGIEYGNEFYFHIPTTGERYNEVNNGLKWLLNEKKYRNSLKEHISYYKSIIQFFNKILVKNGETLPTAVPVGVITAEGKQQNMNLIWNEGIRDSILPIVDGVIHHLYFKAGGNLKVDPMLSENPENASQLKEIKQVTDNFLHVRLPKIDRQFDDFFKLSELGKKMWMTEYNTDHIANASGFFAQWQNTFYHAVTQVEAFISSVDNENNSDVMKYAFPHLWVSHINDYDYGAYASKVEQNGDYKKIKRTTYSAYAILGNLARKKLYQLKGLVHNTKNLERMDLFTKTYFEPAPSEEEDNLGNLILVFSNKSGEDIQINPVNDFTFSIDSTLQNTSQIITDDAEAIFLSADHIYSSNGFTFDHNTGEDKGENVNVSQRKDIDTGTDFTIPGYSVGYLSIPIQNANDTSVPTAVKNRTDVNRLNLYPNPANSSISITLNHQILNSQNTKWELLDMGGKKHSVSSTFDNSHLKIDISSLASGMYQIVLSTDDKRYFSSFIKQ